MSSTQNTSRFLRLQQIIGNSNASPPLDPIIPISASSWWAGVAAGRFPKPVKLVPNTTAWRWEDIEGLLDQLASGSDQ